MQETPAPFVVYPSRTRMAGLLTASLLFVGIGVWMGVEGASDSALVSVLGWIAAVFGVAGGVWFTKRLVRRDPILIVSTDGIEDHGSAVGAGFVPWDDVSQLRLWVYWIPTFPVRSLKFLAVDLKDPGAFQARRSLVRRGLGRVNQGMNAPLISIPLQFMPRSVNLSVLVREIRLRSNVELSPELVQSAGA